MAIQVGDTLLGGKLVIVGVQNDLVTEIKFPSITDVFGQPLTLTFSPGMAIDNVLALAGLILSLNS